MRRPSVLFINRVYPPVSGATGRMLRDLARAFAHEGWQVTVVTTGPKAVKERDGGIRVVRVKGPEKPHNIFSYGWIWVKLLVAALRVPPTHLLVTLSDPPLVVLAGQWVSRAKKSRHINWCHDLYPDIFPALGVWVPGFVLNYFKGVSRRAMNRADKVIVIGRCMAKTLSCSGIDPRAITVIPNWPDEALIDPQAGRMVQMISGKAEELFRNRVSKPPEHQIKFGPKFRVLYAGNIGLAHPIETVLQAAALLNEEQPDIEFAFVGGGSRFEEIARERALRRLENVRLLPFQPLGHLREVMESGDVHLVSVKEEAAGMLVPSKLYSALAVGRPCIFIGPAQSETAKVIHDFGAGTVIAQGDARALADAIARYRHDSEAWYGAHAGALEAAKIFVPRDAIDAWIERAWGVVEPDMREAA